MTIGERLRRSMARRHLTQAELARRAGIGKFTISHILTGRRVPQFDTVEKLVNAIGTTWGDLFDEPRLALSGEDLMALRGTRDLLDRLLANDAAQKKIEIRSGEHEVESLPMEPIPESQYRAGARRAFNVASDSMIGAGILEGAVIYVRQTNDLQAADGQIVVCTLNGTRYLKRLDLRGGRTALESANPRYPTLAVTDDDHFSLVGAVVL